MEKILNSIKSKSFIFKMIPIVIALIGIVFMLIVYSLDIKVGRYLYESIWEVADITLNNDGVHVACLALIVLFIANILMFLIGTIQVLSKKISGLYVLSFSSLCLKVAVLITHMTYEITTVPGVFLTVLGLVFDILAVISTFIAQRKKYLVLSLSDDSKENVSPTDYKILLIMACISLVGFISVFFVPLYTYVEITPQKQEIIKTFMVMSALSGNVDIATQIAFIVVFLSFIALFLYFIHNLSFYSKYKKEFIKRTHTLIYSAFGLTLVYFLIGYFICIIQKIKGNSASTVSYIPFLIMIGILILYSIIKGKYNYISELELKNIKRNKVEPLIYLIVLTLISCMTLFINVIEIVFEYMGKTASESFTGLTLLQSKTESGGYQLVTFVVFTIIITSIVLLIISSAAFFAKNKSYYKITIFGIYTNVIMLFFLGMLGLYYSIAQKINEDNIMSILKDYGYNFTFEYVNEVKSQAIFLFIAAVGVLIIALVRKQLTAPSVDPLEVSIANSEELGNSTNSISESSKGIAPASAIIDFDACPAFTELDMKKDIFDAEYQDRLKLEYDSLTLPGLVKHIVDYARESRLHLSYTHEDIATFVAGLGASKLSILQGMSGTGKTSLPKIFAEAILGNCEVVEVESSWRDKNELLGYYNEFSKSYSPKKFTQRLYKAKLNPEIVTFIVLDEMNLSRIEYYFSDFLSLMEHEEDKREIKLLNVKLHRIENNVKIEYTELEDGHTLKIPANVWFVGTANRDESTFEISDKVYDRAQTMNFNKRAPKVRSYTEPISQKFTKYSDFARVLKEAIANGSFEAEDNEIIKAVEKILQPFNISFGNRVLKQIEEFVKIYCACFSDGESVLNEAVEKIILSKVVSKLEFKNVENKEKLVSEFNKLGLHACSEFVSKLNED